MQADVRRAALHSSGVLVLFCALAIGTPARADDDEEVIPAPDACSANPCRELTREERAAFGRLLSKMMDAMPVPDRLRYKQSAMKSVQGLGQSIVTDEARQSPVFPGNLVDPMGLAFPGGTFPRSFSVAFLYVRGDGGQAGERFHNLGAGELEVFDVRVQVSGYPAAVFAERLSSGRVLESRGPILLWEQPQPKEEQGMALVSMIVGQRTTRQPGATVPSTGGQPRDLLAPLQAVRVDVYGPSNEVRAIAKKIDRKALLALLAPSARRTGTSRGKGAK